MDGTKIDILYEGRGPLTDNPSCHTRSSGMTVGLATQSGKWMVQKSILHEGPGPLTNTTLSCHIRSSGMTVGLKTQWMVHIDLYKGPVHLTNPVIPYPSSRMTVGLKTQLGNYNGPIRGHQDDAKTRIRVSGLIIDPRTRSRCPSTFLSTPLMSKRHVIFPRDSRSKDTVG